MSGLIINPYAFGVAAGGPSADVVLQVQFTGSNGSTTFTDESASAHTLTPAGHAQIQSNKLELDGSGDWVTIADDADLLFDLAEGFTVEVWGFEPDAGGPVVAAYDVVSNDRRWFLTNNPNGSMRVGLFEDGTSASDIISHTWTPGEVDIAVVYDPDAVGDNVYLYIDGTQVATGEFTGISLHNDAIPLTIGGLNTRGTPQSLNGRMSAVRITRDALYTGGSYSVPSLPL